MDLLRNARYNKGLAFTDEERERHYLNGLLPPAVETQELQVSLQNECFPRGVHLKLRLGKEPCECVLLTPLCMHCTKKSSKNCKKHMKLLNTI